jgi:ribonuclease HI
MILIYIDGLCEPVNPNGVATYGFAVYEGDKKIAQKYDVVGEGEGMSNNLAEYAALCEALKLLVALNLNRKKILIMSDSRLLINQMNKVWKCNKGYYISKYNEANNLVKLFGNIRFSWIPREENKEADYLSRKAYDEYCKK